MLLKAIGHLLGKIKLFISIYEICFAVNTGGISFSPILNPNVENRQTIETIRLFDIEYLLPDDEAFLKEYKTPCNVSFGEGQSALSTTISDARSIGKQKTIHWKYELETRLQCRMSQMDKCFFEYLLLRLKDDVFRDMVIVANPWASANFISDIKLALDASTLPRDIIDTIVVKRSELDGLIIERD